MLIQTQAAPSSLNVCSKSITQGNYQQKEKKEREGKTEKKEIMKKYENPATRSRGQVL
jgi:hypothetical protein